MKKLYITKILREDEGSYACSAVIKGSQQRKSVSLRIFSQSLCHFSLHSLLLWEPVMMKLISPVNHHSRVTYRPTTMLQHVQAQRRRQSGVSTPSPSVACVCNRVYDVTLAVSGAPIDGLIAAFYAPSIIYIQEKS